MSKTIDLSGDWIKTEPVENGQSLQDIYYRLIHIFRVNQNRSLHDHEVAEFLVGMAILGEQILRTKVVAISETDQITKMKELQNAGFEVDTTYAGEQREE